MKFVLGCYNNYHQLQKFNNSKISIVTLQILVNTLCFCNLLTLQFFYFGVKCRFKITINWNTRKISKFSDTDLCMHWMSLNWCRNGSYSRDKYWIVYFFVFNSSIFVIFYADLSSYWFWRYTCRLCSERMQFLINKCFTVP